MKKLLFLTVLIAFALAQPFKGPPDADPETMERLRTIMKWRLLEDLEMTDEQTDLFMPLFSKWEKRNVELDERQGEIVAQVKEIMKSEKPDEKLLDSLIAETLEIRQEKYNIEIKFHTDAGEFLDPMRQVKLLTFHERFREDMRGMLHRFKDERKEPRKGER